MIWLIEPVPDFDAEKRRRWYALSFGAAGASALMAAFFLKFWRDGLFKNTGNQDQTWEMAIVFFGTWLLFFALKYVSAYALWYRPYASRRRTIVLSLCATLAVYLSMFGGGVFFTSFRGASFNFLNIFRGFWEFHVITLGLPYFAGALVSWLFARPEPHARDLF